MIKIYNSVFIFVVFNMTEKSVLYFYFTMQSNLQSTIEY